MLQQLERIVPSVSVQPSKFDLGETSTLTLALEGPAPLRFDVPTEAEKWLTATSAATWQIKALGTPKIVKLEDGRERWEQSFRLSAFLHGDRVALAFKTLHVNEQEVRFDAQTLTVRKTLDDAKAENAVPVTGIEQLPPISPTPTDASGWSFIAALAAVFAFALTVVLIRKSREVPPAVPPVEWAVRELQRIEGDVASGRIDDRTATERVSATLREFVERQFGLPATRLTTAELISACTVADWPVERTEPLRNILEQCDRAKFAGKRPDANEMLAGIRGARIWVEDAKLIPSIAP